MKNFILKYFGSQKEVFKHWRNSFYRILIADYSPIHLNSMPRRISLTGQTVLFKKIKHYTYIFFSFCHLSQNYSVFEYYYFTFFFITTKLINLFCAFQKLIMKCNSKFQACSPKTLEVQFYISPHFFL